MTEEQIWPEMPEGKHIYCYNCGKFVGVILEGSVLKKGTCFVCGICKLKLDFLKTGKDLFGDSDPFDFLKGKKREK